MNSIKLLFTCFLAVVILNSCEKESPDFIINQSSNLVENLSKVKLVDKNGNIKSTQDIKKIWQDELRSEGIIVNLATFLVLETFDEVNNKFYFLKTTSENNEVETGAFLYPTNDSNVYRLGSKQCTCVGCPNGCKLRINGTDCSCSSCPKDTSKKCTKTETVIID